jgi:hypothetical protein
MMLRSRANVARISSTGVPARKRRSIASTTSSGPRYRVASLFTRSTAGSASTMARSASSVRRSMPSPMSSSLLSYTMTSAIAHSMTPITTDETPSAHGAPSREAANTPTKASARPASAAESSSSTAKLVGFLVPWMVSRRPRPRCSARKAR